MACKIFVSELLFAILLSISFAQDLKEEQCSAPVVTTAQMYEIQYGDPQNCPQPDSINILETLPGDGWDNLRNVAMGPVLSLNYSNCRITPDRKFLIPDDMHVEALKESDVHIFSQLIKHFSNYTSTTSRTINVEAHASFHIFSISGSYSNSHQTAKMRIAGDKSTTSRSELRFRQYGIRSYPDAQLHPVFQDRVLDIASFVQENDTASARYLSEMLVRDYGTHYVSYVESGALIVQEDQLNSTYVKSMDSDSSTISASASASFLGHFGGGISYTQTVTQEQITKYLESRVDTHTATMGGPPFRANFSINKWIDGMDNNLVTIDRNGDPIYYVITTRSLPMLPLDTIRETAAVIKQAVLSYYKHNVYRGCTSIDSPNFAYIANLDDGSCKKPYTNHSFGGVFQTCTGGLCKHEYSQLNPKTQTNSCPDQYTAVKIYEETTFQCVRRCHHFLFFKYHCYDDCSHSNTSPNAAHIESFWCAATGPVEQNSGYLFGGVYTDTTNNPLTDGKSCPEYFVPLRFGMSLPMYVCVSDDDELGFRFSVPFAGFFSCSGGNPLAISRQVTQLQSNTDNNIMSLAAFTYKAGAPTWPKSCPSGYSQHLLAISEGCEINYCVEANALSQIALPIIKRPPFLPEPQLRHNTTRLLVSATEHLWMKLGGYSKWKRTDFLASNSDLDAIDIYTQITQDTEINPSDPTGNSGHSGSGEKGHSLSTTATVLLSVFGTVVVGFLLSAAGFYVVSYRRKREYRAGDERSGERTSLLGGSNYPATGENGEQP